MFIKEKSYFIITIIIIICFLLFYKQTSAQREHGKNVTVVVRSMCITQRKIVSNIFRCNKKKMYMQWKI